MAVVGNDLRFLRFDLMTKKIIRFSFPFPLFGLLFFFDRVPFIHSPSFGLRLVSSVRVDPAAVHSRGVRLAYFEAAFFFLVPSFPSDRVISALYFFQHCAARRCITLRQVVRTSENSLTSDGRSARSFGFLSNCALRDG